MRVLEIRINRETGAFALLTDNGHAVQKEPWYVVFPEKECVFDSYWTDERQVADWFLFEVPAEDSAARGGFRC